jgi:cellulose synthase/poly-beta-1,6-N-acetylglucosamine synthase-like glycosyltransferase
VAVLNRCIPSAQGEIVVLTDANTMLDGRALKKLMRHFRDPKVGAVCGRLRLFNKQRREYEESAYWAYESLIKFYEGKHGAVLGANGGIYAIRKSLFTPLPPDTIVDDFVIPMRILQAGYRVIYDPEAVAFEETTEDYAKEAGRRARIAAGNFQSLRMLGGMLLPTSGFVSFAFWSHKVLRWVAPFLMATAAASNLMLLGHHWAWFTLLAQICFYGLALAGAHGYSRKGALERAASVAYYFTSMNIALAVGFWRFVRNSQAAAWNRTAR